MYSSDRWFHFRTTQRSKGMVTLERKTKIKSIVLGLGLLLAGTSQADAALYTSAILTNNNQTYEFESGEENVIKGTAYLTFNFDEIEAGERIIVTHWINGRLRGLKKANQPGGLKMNVSTDGEHKFIITINGVKQWFFLFNE